MGAQESSSQSKGDPREEHEHHARYNAHISELYADLTAPDHTGAAIDQKMFRNRFEVYFGGPYLEFGHDLYVRFFGSEQVIDESLFVRSLSELIFLSLKSDYHAMEEFYFSVFALGQDSIGKEGLATLLSVAATYAMVIGCELHERAVLPRDHYIISSLVSSAWVHADKTTDRLHCSNFGHWVSQNCPGLLFGVQQWMQSLLSPSATIGGLPYQLPSIGGGGHPKLETEVELYTMIWALSTVLPPVYLGHKADHKIKDKAATHSVGGEWTMLYSSDKNGLSMNRFQHHCSDYKHPSVLLLTCYDSVESTTYKFAVALDCEWREGTYYYGGQDCMIVQLRPSFHLLNRGPKLVSLNEKQRGFPTGLRVIKSESSELLNVASSFDSATFLNVRPLSVDSVEVWGCGGVEGAESQRRLKEWEKRQILRRRKVKVGLMMESWDTSPDRYLLELGGVTTKRPTEQQQQ